MKEKELDALFKSLEGRFDIHGPDPGHEARFLEKLNRDSDTLPSKNTPVITLFWKSLLAVAACITVCLGVYTTSNTSESYDLASISPEFAQTQDFFMVTIASELKKLNAERTPETEDIIQHALQELSKLETDYEALKTDLQDSNNDTRVIYAMISNFQNRIDVLNNVLDQIDDLKHLKTNSNDTENTL